jgi:glutathione-regulated potassium-efflux system ancillary protein KefC/glutathione-regulated potassium-efflux system protein KefB
MHAAEFGVVIMLFLIGLELKPSLLWSMRKQIFGLGTAQVLITGALFGVIGLGFGLDWQPALAIGLILALSSTAIVLATLKETGLTDTPAGRSGFATLLFQDIAIIPMFALFPLLATLPLTGEGGYGKGNLSDLHPAVQTVVIIAAVGAVVAAGRLVMGPIFRFIAKSRLREIFTATALAVVIGVALLMQLVGLSPALGAFVAGVVLADSEFRHEIEADIEPFRDLLLGLFFITVGASINFALLLAQPGLVIGLAIGLVAVKALVLWLLAGPFGLRGPDRLLYALGLAQGGEFAFVLLAFAVTNGVVASADSAVLIAAVALSMAMTPLLFIGARLLSDRLFVGAAPADAPDAAIENQRPDVLIAGFGRFGQVVGRLLLASGFKTSVLDQSAEHIAFLHGFGVKVQYGDATRIDLLRAAGADDAKLLVISLDDQEAALKLAAEARQAFPHLKILARAYDRRHAYELMARGVDGIERETFEAGVKMGIKALTQLGFHPHRAVRSGRLFRRHDERLMQELSAYWGDDFAAYQTAARQRQGMVDQLMRRDMKAFAGGAHFDDAWDTESLDQEVEAKLTSADQGGDTPAGPPPNAR